MNQIITYLINMIPYIIISLPIIIICRVVKVKKLNLNYIKSNKYREIGMVIFFLYLIIVITQTVLPKFEIIDLNIHFIEPVRNINIYPFRSYTTAYTELINENYMFLLTDILGSILVFIPIGLLLPLLFKKMRCGKNIFLISIGITILLQGLQLFICNIVDVDDILLNLIGALFGFFIFNLLRKHNNKFVKKFRLRYYLRDRKNTSNRINFDYKDEV